MQNGLKKKRTQLETGLLGEEREGEVRRHRPEDGDEMTGGLPQGHEEFEDEEEEEEDD